VLDPACGTGGFLVCALESIRKQDVKNIEDRLIFQDSIVGIEKKSLPYMLSMTNLILHNIDIPQIRHDNSLLRPIRSITNKSRVDVVITNPPFGGMEEDGIESNFPANFRTRETADLFLVLVMSILKDGGRAGIVLPDGFLFGEGVKTRIKEKLLEACNLHTIVCLPNGAFAPYTGINTNLLFFNKGEPTKEIWYFEHSLPEGYKTYNKTKPIRIEEFDLEKAWWEDRVENECAWKVSIEEIKKRNYNLDIKNPHQAENNIGNPKKLLAEYRQLLTEIADVRTSLKNELMDALNREM
ncbi:MAG: N-6 DNA methylase, partial [Deltaproteobacteria bacterium]|nr:N-6 DNA methylase [Deltaproteobacteria bacterium]